MTVAAAAVPLPSSYSCYMDVKMCQGVNKAAKVRGDGLTLPKNASGLLSFQLAQFLPTPPDALLDHLLPQLCVAGDDRHVCAGSNLVAKPSSRTGSLVFRCRRWLGGLWGLFLSSKSCRRLRLWCAD